VEVFLVSHPRDGKLKGGNMVRESPYYEKIKKVTDHAVQSAVYKAGFDFPMLVTVTGADLHMSPIKYTTAEQTVDLMPNVGSLAFPLNICIFSGSKLPIIVHVELDKKSDELKPTWLTVGDDLEARVAKLEQRAKAATS
jgi:hypothetical protein